MKPLIRNRIKTHRRVRAGDLVPHELNFRMHPEQQKAALKALYEEVGFARSLLAYELPDGRLKLIDGHLRRDLDPEQMVDVEVLDVNDDEARKLLLSIDPLAALAQTRADTHAQLRSLAKTDAEALRALWKATAEAAKKTRQLLGTPPLQLRKPEYLIVIPCETEDHQLNLLEWLQAEGIRCKALLS
jgi:hypothetical protein